MTPINMIGDIPLMHYLITASALFVIAVYGMLSNRRSIISILMAIELMLLAININFVAFSVYLQDITGQIFVIFILTIAAAEAAIGFAILVIFFRNKGNIEVNDMNQMRG